MIKKDKNKELSTQQKRTESLYDREIRISVYQVTKQESLPFLPISYCQASHKFQSIKVYVGFEENEENKKTLEDFNKKYNSLVTRGLVLSKRFRRVPKIIFTFDHLLNEVNKLEEIVKKSEENIENN